MSASLHIRGAQTPTSRVIRSSSDSKSISPLAKSPTKRSPKSVKSEANAQYEAQIIRTGIPVPSEKDIDLVGFDIIAGIDFLKAMKVEGAPPKTPRERKVELLNYKARLPATVLHHQLVSLFPAMRNLEQEIQHLIQSKKMIRIPLQQNSEMAYIKTKDLEVPLILSQSTDLSTLSAAEARDLTQAGYIVLTKQGYAASAPNLGLFVSSIKAARKWALGLLKRGIQLDKDLKERYARWTGVIFKWEFILHDLVGSARVETLQLTVGLALRITKRGRMDV